MYFRYHDIAIYPAVAESLLSSKGGEPQR
jgi:hypothetical protein